MAGIHRLFRRLDDIQQANVVVVVAGMEAALPSVIGGLVSKPLIGVPTSVGSHFGGITALLGMLNSCASGPTRGQHRHGFGAGYTPPPGLMRVHFPSPATTQCPGIGPNSEAEVRPWELNRPPPRPFGGHHAGRIRAGARPWPPGAPMCAANRGGFAERFREWGESAYRLDQVLGWLYARRAASWDEMTNLPRSLRSRLADLYTLELPELLHLQGSRDTTRKFLWRLGDGA